MNNVLEKHHGINHIRKFGEDYQEYLERTEKLLIDQKEFKKLREEEKNENS